MAWNPPRNTGASRQISNELGAQRRNDAATNHPTRDTHLHDGVCNLCPRGGAIRINDGRLPNGGTCRIGP